MVENSFDEGTAHVYMVICSVQSVRTLHAQRHAGLHSLAWLRDLVKRRLGTRTTGETSLGDHVGLAQQDSRRTLWGNLGTGPSKLPWLPRTCTWPPVVNKLSATCSNFPPGRSSFSSCLTRLRPTSCRLHPDPLPARQQLFHLGLLPRL